MGFKLRKLTALMLTAIMLFGMTPLDALADIITTDYSEGFSIFSAISTPVATQTYRFYDQGTLVSTQIVKNGETLLEPSIPVSPGGFEFLGWFDALGNQIVFGPKTVQETQVIDATARFSDTYKVSFVYVNTQGKTIVLGTKEVAPGGTVSADGIAYRDDLESNKAFDYWSTSPTGGTAYNFSSPIQSNLTLYLIPKPLWKVTFNTAGGTPILPIFIANGSSISGSGFNPVTTRTGYDFGVWQKSGATFTLDTPITADTALTATWTPRTDTKYTVVYWFENAENTNYSYAGSYTTTGTTDAIAAFNKPTTGVNYGADFTYFTYNATKSETTKTISGDGTTVVNVYYTRNTYRLRFVYYNFYGYMVTLTPPGDVYLKHGASTKPYWDQANATLGYSATWYNQGGGWVEVFPPLMSTSNMTLEEISNSGSATIEFWEQTPGTSGTEVKRLYSFPSPSSGAFIGGRKLVGFTWYRAYGRIGSTYASPGYTYSTSSDVYPYYGLIKSYYIRNIYKISFVTNGGVTVPDVQVPFEGSLAGTSPASYQVGVTTKTVNNIVYSFQGWYSNPALVGDPFAFTGTMPANNIILYAKWAPQKVSVTWYPAWAGGTPTTVLVDYNQTLLQAGYIPTATLPAGMTQEDVTWYRKVGDQYIIYPLDTPVQEGGIVLYPRLPGIGYAVTYDANGGGTPPTDSNTYAPGSQAIVKPAPTAPAGMVFLGWRNSADGLTYYPGDTMPVNSNVTLTAVWGPVDTPTSLTYTANGGTGADVVLSLPNNTTHTVLANTMTNYTRAGYRFMGWDTQPDGSGVSYKPGDSILVDRINEASNILYAQWEQYISLTATKGWNVPNGVSYPEVWFTLYRRNADTTVSLAGATTQVPTISPYTVTWNNLEQTDGAGHTYVYFVKETDAAGADYVPANYTKTESGLTVTNLYKTTSLTATKVWSANSPAIKPTITLQLQQSTDGVNFTDYRTPVNLVNGVSTYTWSELPVESPERLAYTYRVTEINPPASYQVVHDPDGRTITNTYQDTSYTINKVWDYSGVPEASRPAVNPDLQLQLYQDGVAYGPYLPVTGTADLTYTYTWTGLPRYKADGSEHVYVASELVVPRGYQMFWDSATHTITNKAVNDAITGSKVWVGGAPTDGTTVQLQLYQTILGQPASYYRESYDLPQTVSADTMWRYTWTSLPSTIIDPHTNQTANVVYEIDEVSVPAGYYKDTVSSASLYVTNVNQFTTFTADKTWVNGPQPHPDIELYLERSHDGGVTWEEAPNTRYTLTAADGNQHTWTGLTQYYSWDPEPRVKYTYRVQEVKLANYDLAYGSNNEFTNTYVIPTNGTFSATKVWSGGPSVDHTAPVLTLWHRTAQGGAEPVPEGKYTLKVTPDAGTSDTFQYQWTNLETTDINGNPYQFGYVEGPVDGYTTSIDSFVHFDNKDFGLDGSTITNAYVVPLTASLTATKVWSGGPETDHNRVTLTLWRKTATGQIEQVFGKTASVTPPSGLSDTFTSTWSNLEATDTAGAPYTYYYTEDIQPGYTRAYSAYETIDGKQYATSNSTVTNTYVIPTDGTATAHKTWVGGTASSHTPVTLRLWRLLEDWTLQEVSGAVPVMSGTEPNYTYTWNGLERTAQNGYEYTFYFTEDPVPDNYSLAYSQIYESGGQQYAYSGATATNTYVSPKTTASATKLWVSGPDAAHTPVSMKLWRRVPGGTLQEVTGVTPSITPAAGPALQFDYLWSGLDLTDANGVAYEYYFTEDAVPGYTRTYSGAVDIGGTEYAPSGTSVSNAYVIPLADVPGQKVWIDGTQSTRPTVYMQLYRGINADGSDIELVPGLDPVMITADTPVTNDPANPGVYTASFNWAGVEQTNAAGEPYYFLAIEVDASGFDYVPEHYEKYETDTMVINRYIAEAVFTPQVSKALTGRVMKAGEFAFDLYFT